MHLRDFNFDPVSELADNAGLEELEASMRLLGAGEFAAATLSLTPLSLPVHVQPAHWYWACQYYMCGAASGQGCPPTAPWDLRLWHITVFPGYAQKLDMLGYPTPQHLAADFGSAYNKLAHYLWDVPLARVVVERGALRLHARTWLKRFEILGIDAILDGINDELVGKLA